MKFEIPVYIQPRKHSDATTRYLVHPIFFEHQTIVQDRVLGRALTGLTRQLRELVVEWQIDGNAAAIAGLAFSPAITEHRHVFKFSLRRHTVTAPLTLVQFEALGTKIGLAPHFHNVWFDIPKGRKLIERADEALTEHLRKIERDSSEKLALSLAELDTLPHGSTTLITLEVPTRKTSLQKKRGLPFALFGFAESRPDGDRELMKVGLCLNSLFPDSLDRTLGRDTEITQLLHALGTAERRAIAIIGQAKVGKTAIVHEVVRRRVEYQRSIKERSYLRNIWHLSPARLISGMSYLGQWEQRILSILKTSQKRDHVLYFDDMLGLFQAGRHAMSDLAIAHVIKPFVERQECRILAEFTPESWRVFQETDRGFADLFQILRVSETSQDMTYRILLSTARELEKRQNCRFTPWAAGAVYDLQRHYHRDSAFPGKAVTFLKSLAAKYTGLDIGHEQVLEQFHQKSGLARSLLDETQKLTRDQVHAALRAKLIGQDAAVNAMADAVCNAKARLNDPGRPLTSFLFLGPTGVGKTQCAKVLANYLFGDSERLLRFDMNEFPGGDAIGRLIGTFGQPEGQLTAGIRRQPFSVVLFDEIEKAHPAVFDLLLQVLGEGRLTDSLGRTASFANAIVVLTSNLGVREAASQFGFGSGGAAAERKRANSFITAAERFFRPEFFNRIDCVIPFHPLTRAQTASIARQLITEVLSREGLRQRRSVLQVDDAALERLVDQGYHPELGARALRRAVERQLSHSAAAELAALPPHTPVILQVRPRLNQIDLQLQPLTNAAPVVSQLESLDRSRPKEILELAQESIERLAEELSDIRPRSEISVKNLTAQQSAYFAASMFHQDLRAQLTRLQNAGKRPSSSAGTRARAPIRAPVRGEPARISRAAFINDDWHVELEAAAKDGASGTGELDQWLQRLSLLDMMVDSAVKNSGNQVIWIQRLVTTPTKKWEAKSLQARALKAPDWFAGLPGFSAAPLKPALAGWSAWHIDGPAAAPLAAIENGTTIVTLSAEPICVVQTTSFVLPDGADPAAALRDWVASHEDWLHALREGRAEHAGNPWKILPVLRVINDGSLADMRTRIIQTTQDFSFDPLILAHLPLPLEFEA